KRSPGADVPAAPPPAGGGAWRGSAGIGDGGGSLVEPVIVELGEEEVVGAVHRGEEDRSEEHTSELQSREKLVCRLLLGKKKATHIVIHSGLIRILRKLSFLQTG